VQTLKKLIAEHPLYLNAVSFLGDVYMKDGKLQEAKKLYEQTLKEEGLSEADREALRQAINALQSGS
jgi:predicted negative regulator of RcsB-dependent stress response